MDRVSRVTDGLTDYEQEDFRSGRGSVDQIFTLKKIDEKAREKKRKSYVDFMDLGEGYDRVNKEAIWQVLRMYDVCGKLLNGIRSKMMRERVVQN